MLRDWAAWCEGLGRIGIGSLPDVKRTTGGGYRQSQPLTRGNVERMLQFLGLDVRFDMMRQRPCFVWADRDGAEGWTPAVFSERDELGVYQALCDRLAMLDIAAPRGLLDDILLAIAQASRFHPMADWLAGLGEWDGRDYISELAATVETSCELWPVFLENWLVQVVDGVCGWVGDSVRHGLPYCLVLVGAQGVGKTRWLRALGCGWLASEVELHLGSSAGRDHQLAALRWPMAELSELDGIFRKADVAHLKSFLSRETDSIRAPYARRALVMPRMTAFCGSVNVAEFLVDDTGSRRFWPVTVDAIREGSLTAGLLRGVWSQARAYWAECPDFHLTAAEEAWRGRQAIKCHTLQSTMLEKLSGYWEAHKDHKDLDWRPMNRAEILDMLGFRNASNKSMSEAGQYLIENIGRMRTFDKKQRAWLFPFSEFAHDSSTWRRNHLMLVK